MIFVAGKVFETHAIVVRGIAYYIAGGIAPHSPLLISNAVKLKITQSHLFAYFEVFFVNICDPIQQKGHDVYF